MEIYLVRQGDDIECGLNLTELYLDSADALANAERLVKEHNDLIPDDDQYGCLRFEPRTPDHGEIAQWHMRDGHDLIVVEKRTVLQSSSPHTKETE